MSKEFNESFIPDTYSQINTQKRIFHEEKKRLIQWTLDQWGDHWENRGAIINIEGKDCFYRKKVRNVKKFLDRSLIKLLAFNDYKDLSEWQKIFRKNYGGRLSFKEITELSIWFEQE